MLAHSAQKSKAKSSIKVALVWARMNATSAGSRSRSLHHPNRATHRRPVTVKVALPVIRERVADVDVRCVRPPDSEREN